MSFAAAVLCALFSLRAFPLHRPMPDVSIHLPGRPADFKGFGQAATACKDGIVAVEEPHHITVHTSDGDSFTMLARSSSVTVIHGEAIAIYVRRPLASRRFQQVKADALEALKSVGIEPDFLMRSTLNSWADDVPGYGEIPGLTPYTWKAGSRTPFHGLGLDLRLSPDPNGGWYSLMTFSPLSPANLPSMIPATQPSGPPPERQAPIAVKARLLGRAEDIVGMPAKVRQTGMFSLDMLEPIQLELTLPDATVFHLEGRSANIVFFDGVACVVYIRRPMRTTTFEEAKADTLATLGILKLEPDANMNRMMSEWDTERKPPLKAGARSYLTGFAKPIHGANVTTCICPEEDGKFFELLIFSADPSRTNRNGK